MSKDHFPRIAFLSSSLGGYRPVDPRTEESLLPTSRPSGKPLISPGITYGTYLNAIKRVVLERWDQFIEILSAGSETLPLDVHQIDIIAEKHGSDYHPARMRVFTENGTHQFVVNVAVTERGKQRIEREFRVLRSLREEFSEDFVPRVHFLAAVPVSTADGCDTPLMMFFGEWLSGYHEFHLSEAQSDGRLGTVLWDMNHGYDLLTDREAEEVFRRAAHILTYYYDTETFREIFPWHHASGDFVAGRFENRIDVKLITVRQYAPRMGFEEQSPNNAVTALISFLANLTVRMRLDRLDGVGEVAWAGCHATDGTMAGFLSGLSAKVGQGHCPVSLLRQFSRAARELSPVDLTEIFKDVVESYDRQAPDLPVVTRHLPDHILQVYRLLRDFPSFM